MSIEHIATNIRYAVTASSYTREQLADKIGVHRVSLQRYIAGCKVPHLRAILQLTKVLNVTVEDLALPPGSFKRKYPAKYFE